MWRRAEPILDRDTVDGIIRMLMSMNEKLNRIVRRLDLGEDEDDEEMDA